MTEQPRRDILIPCPCGRLHRLRDPSCNVHLRCKNSDSLLVYECRSGDQHRLRGDQKDYVLTSDLIEIGRSVEDGIVINNSTLSRRHARLHACEEGYAVEDLGSRNGTWINERQVTKDERVPLEPGDLLRLGKVYLRYVAPEAVALEETPLVNRPEVQTTPSPDRSEPMRRDSVADVKPVEPESGDTISGLHDPLVGRTLGHYRITGVLAQGGMGRIYRAVHTNLGRESVIKTIRPEMVTSDEIRQRFQQEILTSGKINHNNVLQFFDAHTQDDFFFLAMEYFPGKSLWDLYRKSPGPPEEVAAIGAQAAAALAAAHKVGVVHRDIKPRNILVNDAGVAKVVDFGVAKVLQDPQFAGLTTVGAIVGTPAYMAPEQLHSPQEVDHRIDIYALGTVLFFCLTGRPPYVGRNAGEVLRQVGRRPIPALRQFRRSLPPALEAVVTKCTAKKPEQRFQSASDIVTALEDAVPGSSNRVASSRTRRRTST